MTKPMTLTELKRELKQLDHKELIQLISDLYKSDRKVKEMLSARFVGEEYQQALLSEYKKKMEDVFFPASMNKPLSLKNAKALITDFKKNGSLEMTLDLMLHYVECGNEFTNTYGDIDDQFYGSLCSVFRRFIDELNTKGTESMYRAFEERIDNLKSSARHIGWGYGDYIREKSYEIEWLDDDE